MKERTLGTRAIVKEKVHPINQLSRQSSLSLKLWHPGYKERDSVLGMMMRPILNCVAAVLAKVQQALFIAQQRLLNRVSCSTDIQIEQNSLRMTRSSLLYFCVSYSNLAFKKPLRNFQGN